MYFNRESPHINVSSRRQIEPKRFVRKNECDRWLSLRPGSDCGRLGGILHFVWICCDYWPSADAIQGAIGATRRLFFRVNVLENHLRFARRLHETIYKIQFFGRFLKTLLFHRYRESRMLPVFVNLFAAVQYVSQCNRRV